MAHRMLTTLVVFVVASAAAPGVGDAQQTPTEPPRLADGRPDLQGVWDFRTITPLQRPRALGDRAALTEEEAASAEARAAQTQTAL